MRAPLVMGTRAHHLAMYVAYDNPLPMVCDHPAAYARQPGFEFIRTVPVTWDETNVLAGEPGAFIVVARRKDRTWYLGAMSGSEPRKLVIPLNFLPVGGYQAEIYEDGPNAQTEPNQLRRRGEMVHQSGGLLLQLASGGGAVGQLTPAE